MRRCTPGSQVASQLARPPGVFFRAQFFRQRMHGAHIDVALGLLVQQAALVGADHQASVRSGKVPTSSSWKRSAICCAVMP